MERAFCKFTYEYVWLQVTAFVAEGMWISSRVFFKNPKAFKLVEPWTLTAIKSIKQSISRLKFEAQPTAFIITNKT